LKRFLKRDAVRPWLVPLAGAATLAIAALGATVALWPGRRTHPDSTPASAASRPPLRVEVFDVEVHPQIPPGSRPLGPIGGNVFPGRYQADDVRVKARLSAAAYCYLIALNPDGNLQLCSPEDPAAAPALTAEIDYPADPRVGFSLTDGVGLQAFVLVASREPL